MGGAQAGGGGGHFLDPAAHGGVPDEQDLSGGKVGERLESHLRPDA
jgi:hypothetical protein